MAQHPEVLKKAQAEIDSAVGSARLPTFSDRENLPYVDAVVKECLRISSPVPLGEPLFAVLCVSGVVLMCFGALRLGLPRRITEDNVYKDRFIPKGTLVFGNN